MSCNGSCSCCKKWRKSRDLVAAWQARKRAKLQAAGLCRCGQARPEVGKLCERCKERNRSYVAKSRARKADGVRAD